MPGRKVRTEDFEFVYGEGHLFPRESSNRSKLYDIPSEFGPVGKIKIADSNSGLLRYIFEKLKKSGKSGESSMIFENVKLEIENKTSLFFAMWEGSYGIMNEVGLSVGESSCGSKINGTGVDLANPFTKEKGKALFSIRALVRLALERCSTAVCAILTMGYFSETFGFYAEEFDEGEALTLIDVVGDSWIFHVVMDSTNTGAIWVAKKVPDNHVALVANHFTIG